MYFFPVLAVMILVNYLADPGGIFNLGKEERYFASVLKSGQNLANIEKDNLNERRLQKFYIETLQDKKDVIAVGSSRSMMINKEMFKQKSFFNNSVAGASIEDYLAVVNMYDQKGQLPTVIICGIDPWVFNKNNRQLRWKVYGREYFQFLKKIDPNRVVSKDWFFEKYTEAVSASYFQSAIKKIYEQWKNKETYHLVPTDQMLGPTRILLSDGSYTYPENKRNWNGEKVLDDAKLMTQAVPLYSLGWFKELDQDIQHQFESLMEFFLRHNVRVVLFLAPYHPFMYQFMMNSSKYSIVAEVEKYLRDYSLKNNVLIIGSYNPDRIPLHGEDFYDGIHPRREAIEKMFKENFKL